MPRYWKSVDQWKGDPAFERFIEDEFPSRSEEWLKPVNRREVLRLMAASFAFVGGGEFSVLAHTKEKS